MKIVIRDILLASDLANAAKEIKKNEDSNKGHNENVMNFPREINYARRSERP